MSWGSSYDRNRDLGHSTARARADADAAAQAAADRRRADGKFKNQSTPWVVTPPRRTATSSLLDMPTTPMMPDGMPRWTAPIAPRTEVHYPCDQDLAAYYPIRHPEIPLLHLNHRAHPFTGETILEIMWEDTLPRGREFIPISAVGKNWSGIRSQGVTLPIEVRRDGGSYALRWLAPPTPRPPTRPPNPRAQKVMLGLPGADKKPTFVLLPGSTSSSPGSDGGNVIPGLITKAAAAALIAGAGAAAAWWRNRGEASK